MGADLTGADLELADLENADFKDAILVGAQVRGREGERAGIAGLSGEGSEGLHQA